jgi:excisionase family DNA binding protein
MNNEILNATEAAEMFKVSVAYFRTLAAEGEFPGIQLGSEWRFLKTDLLEYMRERSKREQQERKFLADQNKLEPKPIATRKRGRPRLHFVNNNQPS